MSMYKELGLKPLINAYGTITRIGGSLMAPQVIEAMKEAAKSYVDLASLLKATGERIANLLDVPAAFITSGAAAGACIATAACMVGTDKKKIYQLPDATGLKNEVLIHRTHRNVYDQPIRMAGARLVEFCYANKVEKWQLEAAITEKTAALFYFVTLNDRGTLPFEDIVDICKAYSIPVIVNASAEVPPLSNFRSYLSKGADLVIFSGGKDISGPQGTGLILGKKDLIKACTMNANPNYSIGRPFKVGKEEIIGLTKAIEIYVQQDFDSRMVRWQKMARNMEEAVQGIPLFQVEYVSSGLDGIRPNIIPRVYIKPETTFLKKQIGKIVSELKEGSPAIAVGYSDSSIILNPQVLHDGEGKIVGREVRKILLRYSQADSDYEM